MNEETHLPFNVLPTSSERQVMSMVEHYLYMNVGSPQPKTIIEVGLKRLRSVAGLFVCVCVFVCKGRGVMETKNGKRKTVG